jgi:hypothetical protein
MPHSGMLAAPLLLCIGKTTENLEIKPRIIHKDNMSTELIQFFFQLETHIKLYHWMTTSHSRHLATDKAHGDLLELIDKFVEVYIGSHGRPQMQQTRSMKVVVRNLSDAKAVEFINDAIEFLRTEVTKYVNPNETELWNIRDEIIAVLQQTLYRFTLQ